MIRPRADVKLAVGGGESLLVSRFDFHAQRPLEDLDVLVLVGVEVHGV